VKGSFSAIIFVATFAAFFFLIFFKVSSLLKNFKPKRNIFAARTFRKFSFTLFTRINLQKQSNFAKIFFFFLCNYSFSQRNRISFRAINFYFLTFELNRSHFFRCAIHLTHFLKNDKTK